MKNDMMSTVKTGRLSLMDLHRLFILACDVSSTKQGYNAVPLLEAAKRKASSHMAGKSLRMFITDGLDQFCIAFKKVQDLFIYVTSTIAT